MPNYVYGAPPICFSNPNPPPDPSSRPTPTRMSTPRLDPFAPNVFIPQKVSKFIVDERGIRVRIEKIDVYCYSEVQHCVLYGTAGDPFAYRFKGSLEEFEKLMGDQ